jgi:solute carrier family 25 protein 39/40
MSLGSSTFKSLTPNLGVSACCREVFFANNTAPFCIAEPRLYGVSGGVVGGSTCAVEVSRQKSFNSTFDGMRKIARHEGITTLWRGLSPTLVMTVPANIIYFTGYDWLRHNKASPVRRVASENYAPIFAGASARVLSAVVVSPIEMFRTRMQASTSAAGAKHMSETFHGIKAMVHAQGYGAMWRGLTLTLWRDVPFSGIYWMGYETFKGALGRRRERQAGHRPSSAAHHSGTFVDSFISGASSGAIAATMTMPFDVGKTRRQVFRGGTGSAQAPEQQSMVRLLLHIYRQEGLAGLYTGWLARTLKIAPACAIMISSYEVGKRMAMRSNAGLGD